MTLTPRIFRLFVSSTFSDFIAEREALQQVVFPELEAYCAKQGTRFQAVDLRWGITEEAQREHDTMRICLEEVRRCQQLSPRPNFVVLLGDRYGWEPVPARIPQDHWRRLMKAASPADRELIKTSYRLDENAIPPVQCLRERTNDKAAAFQHENHLLHALRHAARGFRGSSRLPYFASATHQEIALGALSRYDERGRALDPMRHVHVYARHLQGLPNDASAKDFIDWDASTGQVVPGARQRLRGLETQLRRQLGDSVHDLHTTWSRHGRNGAVNKSYIKRFCDAFLGHQKALIDAELASLKQTDERQQRHQAHQSFGAERARVFAGRQALLARIARYTETAPEGRAARPARKPPPAAPLILLGGGGSGKSALLARAAQEEVHQVKRSGAIVLQRYIGGVPGTESLMTTLTALTADIASSYGQPEPSTPESANALAEGFEAALGLATASRPLILYLDALDQLDKADSAWMLEWLPKALPEHVRVVASARMGTSVEQSARRRYSQSLIEVPAMKPAEGRAMLRAWLADKRSAWFNAGIAPSRGRRLTRQQEQAVMAAFSHTGSALWLKLAYEEAATWTSWDAPRELPTTVHGLIEDLIDHRLIHQENHPKVFVERALAYLTAGRFGLSENELGRALGTDKRARTEFQINEKTQRKWEDAKLLPPIIWSRLYFDLQAYLGLAQVDGALLMRWFHREFAVALKAKYLSSEEDRQAIHGALADTFHSLERELRPDEANDDALFKATDASGKQVSAALRRVMEQPWQLTQAGRKEDLQALLMDFGFCMGKCAANAGRDLVDEYMNNYSQIDVVVGFSHWIHLFRQSGHLLYRGDVKWPAHKIFLQVASEHAHDSSLSRASTEWLEKGLCNWVWIRNTKPPTKIYWTPLLRVLEGEYKGDGEIGDVWPISEFNILSSYSAVSQYKNGFIGEIRIWNTESGVCEHILDTGALSLCRGDDVNLKFISDSKLVTFPFDKEPSELSVWNPLSGTRVAHYRYGKNVIDGVTVMPNDDLITWQRHGLVTVRCGSNFHLIDSFCFNENISGVIEFPQGAITVWTSRRVFIWDYRKSHLPLELDNILEYINGVKLLSDGHLLGWGGGEVVTWDVGTATCALFLDKAQDDFENVIDVGGGRFVAWHGDNCLEIWDAVTGRLELTLNGHRSPINGALLLNSGLLVSWCKDHFGGDNSDTSLRVWDIADGLCVDVLSGHNTCPNEVVEIDRDKVVSCANDGARVWKLSSRACLILRGDNGATVLSDQRVGVLNGHTINIWDPINGTLLQRLTGHADEVLGIKVLPSGKTVTWSSDREIRIWDNECIGIPEKITDLDSLSMPVLPSSNIRAQANQINLHNKRIAEWNDRIIRVIDTDAGNTVVELDQKSLGAEKILHSSSLNTKDGQIKVGDSARIEHVAPLFGDLILVWYRGGNLGVWNTNRNSLDVVLRGCIDDRASSLWDGPKRLVNAISKKKIITTSKSDDLFLWDIQSGKLLLTYSGHKGWIQGLLRYKKRFIISWSTDYTLRKWNIDDGVCVKVFHGHSDSVVLARLTSDGYLLSGSLDGTLRIWDIEAGTCLGILDSRRWLEGDDFPGLWLPYTDLIGVSKSKGWCAQILGNYLSVRSVDGNLSARYHFSGRAKTVAMASNREVHLEKIDEHRRLEICCEADGPRDLRH